MVDYLEDLSCARKKMKSRKQFSTQVCKMEGGWDVSQGAKVAKTCFFREKVRGTHC